MLIIVSLIIMLIVGIIIIKKTDSFSFLYNLAFVFNIINSFALGIILILLFVNYLEVPEELIKYKVLKTELINSRSDKNISDVERATVFNKVVDLNTTIEIRKYWNSTLFDIFIPDTLTKLENIK